MTSSILEPVSISAVAMMESEPPSSMLRAAPKKRFGPLQRVGVDAAGQHLAGARHDRVVGAAEAGDGVEQDHDILLVLDQALGLLDHHLGDLDVALRRLVEGRGDDLALHRALHVGDFLRPLVDQQDDQEDSGLLSVIARRCSAEARSCRSAAARRSARAGPCRAARRCRSPAPTCP
jgi:hypothetical protein